jgi:acetylornithine deacetylase/succinyl-diaminopimelate desuccinylase-like protein
MAYSAGEARGQLLEDVAEATDQLALALASLGEAYEELDEQTADALEEQLFRPTQSAYGRLRRTHAEFAARVGLPVRNFGPSSGGLHSADPRVYVERAVEAIEQADHVLAELQDSMLPVEVGDRELRAGLSETRETIAELPARARRLMRTQGR